jgi:hypothetical protein
VASSFPEQDWEQFTWQAGNRAFLNFRHCQSGRGLGDNLQESAFHCFVHAGIDAPDLTRVTFSTVILSVCLIGIHECSFFAIRCCCACAVGRLHDVYHGATDFHDYHVHRECGAITGDAPATIRIDLDSISKAW